MQSLESLVSLGVVGKDDGTAITFVENAAAASSSVAPSSKSTCLFLIQSLVGLCKSRIDPKTLLEVCTSTFVGNFHVFSGRFGEDTRCSIRCTLGIWSQSVHYWRATWRTSLSIHLTTCCRVGWRTVSMLSSTMTSLSHVIIEFRSEAGLRGELSATIDTFVWLKCWAPGGSGW
jgi:hypothetical protein